MKRYILILALAAAGCHDNNNGNGTHDMAMNGGGGDDMGGEGTADMADRGDMTDTTTPPAPTTMHVGGTGPTAGLVTAGVTAAAYVLNPTAGAGELHVVTADGTDKTVDTAVPIGNYQLTRDGKQVIYAKASGQAGSLLWADVSGAAVTKKTITGTYASAVLSQGGFMAPSGHFFLAGMSTVSGPSLDMHVIRMTDGADVFDRLNGGFDYLEIVLPDDTCIYQDTTTGTGTGTGSPPVQTLYWTALPMTGTTTTATAINTRTASFTPSGDNKQLFYLKTSGDLYSWDASAKTGMGTKIASSVAKFTVGDGAVAYVGADGSVHVASADGATKMLDTPASKDTSLFAPIALAPDNADVYFFQNGDLSTGGVQNSTGTLMRVAVKASATASKVADKVSIADLQVFDNAIVFLQNLGVPPIAPAAQYGDVAMAKRDGTGITALGTKSPVGGLMATSAGPGAWSAMFLTTGVDDANSPTDGSPPVLGALTYADYTGAAAITLDATVHQGEYGFALDDPRTAAFVTGAAFNATAGTYVGSLAFLATKAPSTKVDGMLAGVAQLGPILNRSLFVSAPTAATAGVYFVKY